MVDRPGSQFAQAEVVVGEFTLDYVYAGPPDADVTVVSFPGSAGLEMSVAKDTLAQNFQVVEINPPGWSGKDDLARPMAMSELGELLGEAANQLVPRPYFLIGTSMGGTNAVYAAARNPERVRGLILEGSMSPSTPNDMRLPPPVLPADANGDQVAPEPAGLPPYPLPPLNPKKPWATEEFVRDQMEKRFKMFRWVEPEMLPKAALKAVNQHQIPVLALLGDEDEVLKPSQQKTLVAHLPRAEFTLIAGGAHDLQNTAPGEFVATVKKFIANNVAAKAKA